MGNPFETRMNIRYKGQDLSFLALVNRDTGDLVQLEEVEYSAVTRGRAAVHRIKTGAVWCPNRDLARRTEHSTQYACFKRGLYDRMRGGWHIGQRYGVRGGKPGTESQELMRDRDKVREIVIRLMTSSTNLTERQLWLIKEMLPLVEEYISKYDVRKVMALQDMSRGMILKDSKERLNVGASGMALGAAIGNLEERQKAVSFIDARMDQRARVVAAEIARVRNDCRLLWCGFRPGAAAKWAYQDAGWPVPEMFEKRFGWMEMMDDKSQWRRIASELEMRHPAFERMRALPFRRNALRTQDDIAVAVESLRNGEEMRARGALVRLREGIRWFFVADRLQMRVITPLTLLEYDLWLEHRASPVPGAKRDKFVLSSALAEPSFAGIRKEFESWDSGLPKCEDDVLASKVKNRIAPQIDRAHAAIAKDDWLKAKKHMLSITEIL